MKRKELLAKIEKDARTLRDWELAHILSQPYPWAHTRIHFKMLIWAIKAQDLKEFVGQIPRLLLAYPSSLFGFAPNANPGSTRFGLATDYQWPSELPLELKDQR
jgi:hypothetical protein